MAKKGSATQALLDHKLQFVQPWTFRLDVQRVTRVSEAHTRQSCHQVQNHAITWLFGGYTLGTGIQAALIIHLHPEDHV
ncbi:hypothetical protein FQN50_003490 [Emmonsiellopsis sp. PD_5]|nr:hypothetical protein FQN50_003490 [Emmonsiellopsis sp. PD_5]